MATKRSKKNDIKQTLMFVLKVAEIVFVALIGVFFTVALILPRPFYKEGFKTLKEVERYAASTNELTPLESDNAVKPDFTNYYSRFAPSIKNTILAKVGGLLEKLRLKSPPFFSPSFFKTVIEDVNAFREQAGFKHKTIVKVAAKPTSKFIVIGDLQGAFHSLVRDCLKLKELGILDDDLKIVAPDCYIVFLGNVPSRSPFSMEIVALILRLMQQNPERVLYTKGSHENDRYWEEHTLKTELKVRASVIMQDTTPLIKEVNRFFDSLPSVIYLAAPASDKNAFVRIGQISKEKFDDKYFAQFLMADQKGNVSIFSWEENNRPAPAPDMPHINVKAIMRVEKKRETYQPSEGLRTLAPEMGITTWTLLSGPTLAVEKGFKFYNDTFALIEAADHIDQWKVTLYYQDRREKKGYKTQVSYLTSGRDTPVVVAAVPASQPRVEQNPVVPVVVPSSTPVTPVAAPIVVPVTAPSGQLPVQQPEKPIEQKPAAASQSPQAVPGQAQAVPTPAPQAVPTPQPPIEHKPVVPVVIPSEAPVTPVVAPAVVPVAAPSGQPPVQPEKPIEQKPAAASQSPQAVPEQSQAIPTPAPQAVPTPQPPVEQNPVEPVVVPSATPATPVAAPVEAPIAVPSNQSPVQQSKPIEQKVIAEPRKI